MAPPVRSPGAAGAVDILSWDGDDQDRWRLVILEDAGELIASDARAVAGQALSRLLNVADGILGQGTRTMLLITTNEPVKRLHPAARRPGRCLSDLEFTPLSTREANHWLAAHERSRRVERPTSLAELFGRLADGRVEHDREAPRFGFAQALVPAPAAPAGGWRIAREGLCAPWTKVQQPIRATTCAAAVTSAPQRSRADLWC